MSGLGKYEIHGENKRKTQPRHAADKCNDTYASANNKDNGRSPMEIVFRCGLIGKHTGNDAQKKSDAYGKRIPEVTGEGEGRKKCDNKKKDGKTMAIREHPPDTFFLKNKRDKREDTKSYTPENFNRSLPCFSEK